MSREEIPQGYEPHEIPPDYVGQLFLEGQMRAAIEAEREACARICETEFCGDDVSYYVATAIRARGK
jgi:hypothetical protein